MTHPLWTWERVEGDQLITEHTLNGPDVLCRYWGDNPPTEHALLLAAAPDLLVALEAWINHRSLVFNAQMQGKLDDIPTERIDEIVDQARAAIKAATEEG